MSNLMNQARLKVLKARDDMISVGNTFGFGFDVGGLCVCVLVCVFETLVLLCLYRTC